MIGVGDEQWSRIREHFPEQSIAEDRPGSRAVAARKVLDAVLTVLNTGVQRHMLAQYYPN